MALLLGSAGLTGWEKSQEMKQKWLNDLSIPFLLATEWVSVVQGFWAHVGWVETRQ